MAAAANIKAATGYFLSFKKRSTPDYSASLDCRLNCLAEFGNNILVTTRSGDSFEDPSAVKVAGLKSGIQMSFPKTVPR